MGFELPFVIGPEYIAVALFGAVIGIMTFIVLAIVSLITYRSSGSYKNEEAFR